MPQPTERMKKLQQMLERDPDDLFLLYAVALEHRKGGALGESLSYLNRVLEKDAGYLGAYLMAGQVHEAAGDLEAARRVYRKGIEVARAKGESHAASEMEAALAIIE